MLFYYLCVFCREKKSFLRLQKQSDARSKLRSRLDKKLVPPIRKLQKEGLSPTAAAAAAAGKMHWKWHRKKVEIERKTICSSSSGVSKSGYIIYYVLGD